MTDQQHDPVKAASDAPDLRRMLEEACAQRGLLADGARLIHRYSNAVYLLPAEQAVARMTVGSSRRIRTSQAVAGWLVDHADVAATAPLPGAPPAEVGRDTVVSFWIYYPQPHDRPEPTSAHLARVLRQLHDVDEVPVPLDQWQPLTSLVQALDDPAVASNLSEDEHEWLLAHAREVRAQIAVLDSPLGHGVIHGDAWAGNLLWNTMAATATAVLGDWDWVSYGPREIDLIPTWHAATRYGRGQEWADAFAEVYGYDLLRCNGFKTLLLMRDLMQLTGPLRRAADDPTFMSVLRQRLDGIRNDDRQSVWKAL